MFHTVLWVLGFWKLLESPVKNYRSLNELVSWLSLRIGQEGFPGQDYDTEGKQLESWASPCGHHQCLSKPQRGLLFSSHNCRMHRVWVLTRESTEGEEVLWGTAYTLSPNLYPYVQEQPEGETAEILST